MLNEPYPQALFHPSDLNPSILQRDSFFWPFPPFTLWSKLMIKLNYLPSCLLRGWFKAFNLNLSRLVTAYPTQHSISDAFLVIRHRLFKTSCCFFLSLQTHAHGSQLPCCEEATVPWRGPHGKEWPTASTTLQSRWVKKPQLTI